MVLNMGQYLIHSRIVFVIKISMEVINIQLHGLFLTVKFDGWRYLWTKR